MGGQGKFVIFFTRKDDFAQNDPVAAGNFAVATCACGRRRMV